MDGIGESVSGAAELAFRRGIVACSAKAVAGPDASAEDGGYNAILLRG